MNGIFYQVKVVTDDDLIITKNIENYDDAIKCYEDLLKRFSNVVESSVYYTGENAHLGQFIRKSW